jgi:hypothetical protein
MADHFALHREHLFASPSLNVVRHGRPVPSVITFSAVNRAGLTMDFRSTHDFNMKKADNSANFAAGGIINRWIHHN